MRQRNRHRVSVAQVVREVGPRARTAFRHARVWLWRFKRSPERRDRAAAFATFAFIGLFAVASFDAIVTGGADFDPGTAYAMDYPTQVISAPARAPAPAVETETRVEAEKAVVVEEVDYSFTTEELLGGPEETTLFDEFLFVTGDGKTEASAPVADVNPKDATL